MIRLKSMIKGLGLYDVSDWGLTPYPDRALVDAIDALQRSQGLKRDKVRDVHARRII